MESATLFFLASGMGVMFGWQPMPDGSARYEYVVQLEPELIETLEEGQSIPISSDVPEDIHPIGRIRIVVGSEALPRTKLTTRFKPVQEESAKKSREGVFETQYTVPPVEPTSSGRYGSTGSQQILPPGNAPPAADQRFAQALRSGSQPSQGNTQILPPQNNPQGLAGTVQRSTQQLGSQLRNVGESVRTDAQQMFGQVGNDVVSGALGKLGDAVNRVGQGVQQNVEPLRQSAQQTGQQMRNTLEGLGQQTREAVDRWGRPLREKSILSAGQDPSQSILPPSKSPPQQQFTGSQSNSRGQRLDQPVDPQRGGNRLGTTWNDSPPITPDNTAQQGFGQNTRPIRSATSSPRAFDAPWPPLPSEEARSQTAQQNQPPQYSSQQPTPSQDWPNKTKTDRFDIAGQPTTGSQPANNNPGGRYGTNDSRSGGPSLPNSYSDQSPQLVNNGGAPQQPSRGGESSWPSTSSSAPEVRRHMLDQPADADFQTIGSQPALATSGYGSSPPLAGQPQASDFNWDNRTRIATNNEPIRNEGPRSVFPLIISWVLLSGSGAGNLYLFWSYLDVRGKYRGLIHNARGGSRHSRLD